MKAEMSNHMVYFVVFAILVAAIGSVAVTLWLGGSAKSTSGPTTTIANTGSGSTTYQSPNPIASNPSCTAPNQAQTFAATVFYPDYSKPQYNGQVQLTAVGSQNINTYSQYPTKSAAGTYAAVSSSTTAVTVPASGTLSPCITYLLTAGDNSGYFLNYTFANPQTATSVPISIVAPKYTAPTLSFNNLSSGAGSTVATQIHSVTASSAKSYTFYIALQSGAYTSCFAFDSGCELSFTYNNLAVSSITPGGLSPSSLNAPSMSQVTANTLSTFLINQGIQNTQVNFLLPGGLANSQYATGTSASSASLTWIPVVVQTTSAIATNEVISVQVTAGTGYFNSTSAGMNFGQFKNPQTNANLFAPVTTANALILRVGA